MTASSPSSLEKIKSMKDMIVFSHLRWEFVKQRPQHLIERLAKGRKVLFVEEPIGFSEEEYGTYRKVQPTPEITFIQPRIRFEDWDALEKIVEECIADLKLDISTLWFYSPSFVEMADRVDAELIVFDCMDQLSAFKGAPPELISNEKKLLSIADVVFTGGKSLYEEKKKYHDNVYCFPSSVERKHFEKALSDSTTIPTDIEEIAKPVIGYYGVIDERIDLNLLKDVAFQMPDASFVMIGPLAKISEDDLPQATNIHYLGGKNYAELPEYLKAFDVAMMPFALNESTEFISPTKTLEFMAALKPIVSTPIFDVKRDYEKEVKVVTSAEEFVSAILAYLHESPDEKARREKLETQVIDRTSWDKTAQQMLTIMTGQIAEKLQSSKKKTTSSSSTSMPVSLI